MQDWARSQGWDWSADNLKQNLLGRWCRFEGWLFFDKTHDGESENIAPGREANCRATAWEIHPITRFALDRSIDRALHELHFVDRFSLGRFQVVLFANDASRSGLATKR